MLSSLYTGASGMKGLAEGMQVITNNVANVSTIGFKQQNILFSDQIYQAQGSMGSSWQPNSKVAMGQIGLGLQVEAVRTLYTQGALESTNSVTDMAIDGKGFFQVSDGARSYYTRAGDFSPDDEGVWRIPTGHALMGYRLGQDSSGALEEVQVDRFATLGAQASTRVDATFNLNWGQDNCVNSDNPYFSMLEAYNPDAYAPLSSGAYSYSQSMTLYDASGTAHNATIYFDGAPSSGTTRNVEFLIADGLDTGGGALMSGVLQFDSNGKLSGIAAFTPQNAGSLDLADWKPAALNADGLPQLNLDGAAVGVNFGASMASGWGSAPASAAAVGSDGASLAGMASGAQIGENASTAYNSSTPTGYISQDGYGEGYLSNVSVNSNGVIVGRFSNGQEQELWQIPVARFTSEDGLYREGGNLFSATAASGQMELGMAGTENYGSVRSYNIEGSNVDMATEMVNMIVNQRGFQSNSKVVMTADALLQKAMELKRT